MRALKGSLSTADLFTEKYALAFSVTTDPILVNCCRNRD